MEQPLATTQTNTPSLSVLGRSLALMKPVTWFAPMWAFVCGAVASGGASWQLSDIGRVFLGVLMAGPLLCGVSQVINDYFDREVDALNEPDRLIPSGRISLAQIAITILILSLAGVAIAVVLGRGLAFLAAGGILLGLAYSAPPLRAKRNAWFGNLLAGVTYEGFAWIAGHLAFAALTGPSILLAVLYSLGTHGIMSINDYKSIEGDKIAGINTIPVLYGTKTAAWMIVLTMDLVQLAVAAAFLIWGNPLAAAIIFGLVVVQFPIQRNFIREPEANYLKFSAIGVNIFVWGMMVAAIGLRAVT
ncbi:MAG: chlorophyll synthase ChlG [Chloroflexi bacterium]|nr:chlorophyll synthase ChlG [Chloroflexota bacterium]